MIIIDHYLNYEWVRVNLATVTREALEAIFTAPVNWQTPAASVDDIGR